jgi:hypothetical protein
MLRKQRAGSAPGSAANKLVAGWTKSYNLDFLLHTLFSTGVYGSIHLSS